jgi:uncharacterized protein YkwD
MLTTVGAFCAGLSLMVVPSTDKPAAKPALFEHESRVLEKTNAERARHGLRPLELDKHLLDSARGHAAWMTRTQNLQHTGQPVGENIAMGQSSSTEVVRDWMNSPGHRANILNPGYTRIGVAAYTTPNGTTYWCQQFLR